MKAHWDETELTLTLRMESAALEYMRATCEMMKAQADENAECWAAGRANLSDLSQGPQFEFGPADNFQDGLGDFAVVSPRPARSVVGDVGEGVKGRPKSASRRR